MKILHLSTSELIGGAAIAASRLNKSLNKKSKNIESKLLVIYKQTDDCDVFEIGGKFQKIKTSFKNALSAKIQKLQFKENKVLHSLSLMPSNLSKLINESNFDIINLHWVQGEMISIEDIGRIKKPIIWTLHDAWAFSGSEHFQNYNNDIRFIDGYFRKNKLITSKGLDLDRFTWIRKKKNFPQSITLVCPSKWLTNCVINSSLFCNNIVHTIPNPLPTDIFKPYPKNISRELFKVPKNTKLILFGALSGINDFRKGFDLLYSALKKISDEEIKLEVVIFGQSRPKNPPKINLPIHFVGRLHDKESLALLYSAVDLMVVPSRIENLPQTATEAQSCGLPVVAFNTSGMPDIVLHKKTGYLCDPFSVEDLATGIKWVIENIDRYTKLRSESRKRAQKLWSEETIVQKYQKIYQSLLSNK